MLLIAGFLADIVATPSSAEAEPRSVLILDGRASASLSPGYAELIRAFRDALAAKSRARIYAINLDSNEFSGHRYVNLLKDYIREKYRNIPISVLFAISPAALELALQLQAEDWHSTSIVFAAVDESSADRMISSSGSTKVTGRTLRFSLSKSLEVAHILVPDLKRIALIGDPLQKQVFRQHFQAELKAVPADLEVIDLTGLPLATVKSRIADLPSDAAIVYTSITDDGAGRTLLPLETLEVIAEAANRPIVVDVDNRIGRGGTGGFVVSAPRTGEEAAQLTQRLFEGEAAAGIPITPSDAMTLAFDWRQLKRWNVDEAKLPASSEIRFREQSAWEQYRLQIVLLIGAILMQGALIVALLKEDRRRRRAEARTLELSSDLAHVNRVATAGELTASIAHEVRQPLAAIVARGNAGLNWLRRETPDLDKVRSALENVVESGHRADEVLQNMRAMLAKQNTRRVLVNVNTVVQEVLVLAAGKISEKGVRIVTSFPEDPPPNVVANRVQLQQVLLNLIMNAVEAMDAPKRGDRVLTLATEINQSGHVLIMVRDSGPGIASDQLDNIFKSFFTTKPNGMGIGLAICKTIVEAHAGKLKAMPGAPMGMVFTIELPLFGKAAVIRQLGANSRVV
jgi:signal transduction histidine kinase